MDFSPTSPAMSHPKLRISAMAAPILPSQRHTTDLSSSGGNGGGGGGSSRDIYKPQRSSVEYSKGSGFASRHQQSQQHQPLPKVAHYYRSSTNGSYHNDDISEITGTNSLDFGSVRQGGRGLNSSHDFSTMKKLRVDELGMYGRKRELTNLETAVHRMATSSASVATASSTTSKSTTSRKMESITESAPFTINDTTTTSTTAENSKSNEFTANRQKDVENPLASAATPVTQQQVVLLSGYSGTGKSVLAASVKEIVENQYGGSFVEGKFDQCLGGGGGGGGPGGRRNSQQQQRPFTAFRMICENLAYRIVALKKKPANVSTGGATTDTTTTETTATSFERLKEQIMAEVGDEINDLIQVFPALEVIISNDLDDQYYVDDDFDEDDSLNEGLSLSGVKDNDSDMVDESNFGTVTTESRNRFNYAFRTLLRIISATLSPLILVLDDLQWAEGSSLDLLETILSDRENSKYLMLIGIYRSNEVDETHLLTKTLQHMKSTADQNGLSVTEMEISNLDIDAVVEMLQDCLSMSDDGDADRVRQLAEICLRKTGGNAFYLVHFISMLHDRDLLEYNVGTMEWVWDAEGIEQATSATDNVVDILKRQIAGSLSRDHRLLLEFGAYLGSVFDEQTLFVLWKDFLQNGSKGTWTIDENSGHSSHRKGIVTSHDDTATATASNVSQNQKSEQGPSDYSFEQATETNSDSEATDEARREDASAAATAGTLADALMKGEDSGVANFDINDEEQIRELLQRGLRSCQKRGFLQDVGKQTYRWVHDKLQEAALNLIPATKQAGFSLRVAEVLRSQLNDKELEAAIFVIANRYNEGETPSDLTKRMDLARLNLRAAKKAVSFAAFENAATYCAHGIELLPKDCWEKHCYQLSLELYSLGAETEGFLANVDTMEKYCTEILKQEVSYSNLPGDRGSKKKPMSGRPMKSSSSSSKKSSSSHQQQQKLLLTDKTRAYNVMIKSIGNRNLYNEAIELCLDVLGKYGAKFPSGKAGTLMRTAVNIIKIKAGVKKRTAEEVQNLPIIQDRARIEQMGFADKLATYLYVAKHDLLPLVVFKSLQWTFDYGLCIFSPAAFASTAVILTGVLGDFSAGTTYAKYALMLMNRLEPLVSKQIESRITFLVHNLALHWTQPLDAMLKPALRGYEIGMQTGDVESATWCANCHLVLSFLGGKDLILLERDCRLYVPQMKELKMIVAWGISRITWQAVLNLIGFSESTTKLTGEVLDEDACKKEAKDDPFLMGCLMTYSQVIQSFFGEYESAAELALQRGDCMQQIMPGSPTVILDAFHRCLSLFGMARKIKEEGPLDGVPKGMESKYFKAAKRTLGKIKRWVEQGNLNMHHHECFLDAEYAAYEGRQNIARKHYETAADLAGRNGYLQDCALANERYGKFLLWLHEKEKGDILLDTEATKDEAIFRLKESIKYYREWGALAKVEHLEQQYESLVAPRPTEIVVH